MNHPSVCSRSQDSTADPPRKKLRTDMAGNNTLSEGERRQTALKAWDNQLDQLVEASHGYMRATSNLLKECPLNDTAPLEASAEGSDAVTTVPETFAHISERLHEISLSEEQIKLSRTSLTTRRNRMARVSAVSRLPEDLLQLVFQYVVEKPTQGPEGRWAQVEASPESPPLPNRLLAYHRPEIILTWVCQQWRDIALNSPLLWRRTEFLYEEPPFFRSRKYLVRSQEVGLDVVLRLWNMPAKPFINKDIYLISAIGTVLPQYKRWKDLTVHVDSLNEMRSCFSTMIHTSSATDKVAPELRTIDLRIDPKYGMPTVFDEEMGKFWLEAVQKLDRLSLKNCTIPWTWTSWFSTLKHLSISFPDKSANSAAADNLARPPWLQFKIILSAMTELEVMELNELKFRDVPSEAELTEVLPFVGTPPILTKLHTLHLGSFNVQAVFRLLGSFSAPNLHTLYLGMQSVQESWSAKGLLPFFERYSHLNSPVKRFWIEWSHDVSLGHILPRYVQHLRNLEELVVQKAHFSEEMLRCMTPGAVPVYPVLCPNLRVLRLLDAIVDTAGLYDMLHKRMSRDEAEKENRPASTPFARKLQRLQFKKGASRVPATMQPFSTNFHQEIQALGPLVHGPPALANTFGPGGNAHASLGSWLAQLARASQDSGPSRRRQSGSFAVHQLWSVVDSVVWDDNAPVRVSDSRPDSSHGIALHQEIPEFTDTDDDDFEEL